MPRRRLEPGTAGEISTRLLDTGVWVARCWYRSWSGKRRQLERRGQSRPKAENALKAAVRDALSEGTGEGASSGTRLSAALETFLQRKADEGVAERTLETYRYGRTVICGPDGIGDLTLSEANAPRVAKFLRETASTNGAGTAKTCRSVLSGVFGLAIADGAIDENPIRHLGPQKRPKPDGAKPIPLDDLQRLDDAIAADPALIEEDLADLFRLLLRTGLRMGEVCALRWAEDVDLDNGTISVRGTMIRVAKQGVHRQDKPKTDASIRTITLPAAATALLRARHETQEFTDDLVFPDRLLKPRDPGRVEKLWRQRRDVLGVPTATSHSFRKSVATLLDKAGLSAREIADYLGHARPSMTQDVYMQRHTHTGKAAEAITEQIESGEFRVS